MFTLSQLKNNSQILSFIKATEEALRSQGYNDHGLRHSSLVADRARTLAKEIGLSKKDQELAAIAGFCHDMGNFIGRSQHHYWAALLFSQVFLGRIKNRELTTVMQAIVNHDKATPGIFNKISAIVILADKSDVHRSRVTEKSMEKIRRDIHDRVNYAVKESHLRIDKIKKEITLELKINIRFIPLMDYFEIFTPRMSYCRKAARYLGYKFGLEINNFRLL